MTNWFEQWAVDWISLLIPGGQVLLIALAAWSLQRLLARGLTSLAGRYHMPPSMLLPLRGTVRWLIIGSALLLILERFGVSASVLWTALTGFLAVAALAFFAIWSVLSNIFCAALIFTVGPFRLGDRVEVMESADKPGVKGRVVMINIFYTTLEDLTEGHEGALLQIPNSLFFQKVIRRWRGPELPQPQEK
ncbi:mechanosensitive ion channel family protein [Pseudomonas sp. C27(2019)]|uniref:mechanosensitive ion channel family protein n=1 Tax=Pseudomonas sp. C27(2019) TaxID=2604941 RepID=UPI0012443B14|nr:mechanosensitive ion channel family protein [Pseudomonas sp. C27(2019)]QEY59740.1 mechanosensitive ion channel family protein [Pseudomonas sp. C27(2019)]